MLACIPAVCANTKQACVAIDTLCAAGTVDTLLSSFIVPLQTQGDKNNRIHCSLNLNTETGRLSARRCVCACVCVCVDVWCVRAVCARARCIVVAAAAAAAAAAGAAAAVVVLRQ